MQTHINVDTYIASQPPEYGETLQKVRKIIQELAPESVETISYGMPGYKHCDFPLVYFASAKKYLGFYPTPSGITHFQEELSQYKTSKGSVQFPYSQPIPFDLIEKIIQFRIAENQFRIRKK